MTDTLLKLSETTATALARIALGHVAREYPNKLDHVIAGPEDVATPSALHPIFFGSFDWHSCVHGYWLLARLLRRYPGCSSAAAIRALFDASFTPDRAAGECAYFDRPASRGFERPYGWAWLLKLTAELQGLEGGGWARMLQPLASIIVTRFESFLPLATYPIRAGTHGNTAFALALAADHAETAARPEFRALLQATALRWYGDDADCQAWEPGGDDFLSSALIEAEAMRRLLPEEAFRPWFDRFLPHLGDGAPASLFRPVTVTDRSDGKLAHLDGVNLSRAWCWRALARSLPAEDARRPGMEAAAAAHLSAGLPFVAGDYMGEHWLASFALLALDES